MNPELLGDGYRGRDAALTHARKARENRQCDGRIRTPPGPVTTGSVSVGISGDAGLAALRGFRADDDRFAERFDRNDFRPVPFDFRVEDFDIVWDHSE